MKRRELMSQSYNFGTPLDKYLFEPADKQKVANLVNQWMKALQNSYGINDYQVSIQEHPEFNFESMPDAETLDQSTLMVDICIKFDEPIEYIPINVTVKEDDKQNNNGPGS